jgi:fumarate reductase subunit D
MRKQSNEPLFWSLFSAGGVVTAFFMPALIVLIGFVLAANEISLLRLEDVFDHVAARVWLVVFSGLAFFHFAHRFRFTLIDLGLHSFRVPVAVLLYGAALGGTVFAIVAVVVDWS